MKTQKIKIRCLLAKCDRYSKKKHFKKIKRCGKIMGRIVEKYSDEKLSARDLKPAVAKSINAMIEPVRKRFKTDPQAKKILELVDFTL
jgi:hypothetical protein